MYVYNSKNVKQENIQVNKQSTLLRKLLPWLALWRQLIGNIGWFPRMVINDKAQRMQNFYPKEIEKQTTFSLLPLRTCARKAMK